MSAVRFHPKAPLKLLSGFAGVAQLAEQLICNQQVAGSIPVTSSKTPHTAKRLKINTGGLQSGQMHQTVNLTSPTSVVRIHLLPPQKEHLNQGALFALNELVVKSPLIIYAKSALRIRIWVLFLLILIIIKKKIEYYENRSLTESDIYEAKQLSKFRSLSFSNI